ncbi:hypothetical protein [Bradyrhizobium sp. CCBAU 21362]|uniref:hypothetical protein n=1 Tax=Bradyrhizobium sp. CCBAU 21362 TaxID=1325082 RepID=UPI0023053771|nr:hypothetical protein [Bradyrhizobium sp. CCBAU 21362]
MISLIFRASSHPLMPSPRLTSVSSPTLLPAVAKGRQGRLSRMDRAGLETAVRQGILDEAADQSFISTTRTRTALLTFQVSSTTDADRLA